MKRIIVLILLLLVMKVSFAEEIYWYAAAAAVKPIREIVNNFNKNSEDKIILITGGSGQLLNKIKLTKIGDIYSPASTIFAEKAEKSIGFKPVKLLSHSIVFGLSAKGKFKVKTFSDLYKKDINIALGNPGTMSIGKIFYNKVLVKFNENEKSGILKNKIIDPVNIAQTVNYLKAGTVDAGLLFDSTAKANNIDYISLPNKYHFEAIYYIGPLKYTKNYEKVDKIIKYVKSHGKIFEKYGFKMVN